MNVKEILINKFQKYYKTLENTFSKIVIAK